MPEFEGQKPDEVLIFLIHQDPFYYFREGVKFVALSTVPLVALIFAGPSWAFSAAFAFWLLVGGAITLNTVIRYLRTKFILTNQRLITTEQRSFFHQVMTETPLEKILDVTSEVRGLGPTLFGYGTVLVQTIGGVKLRLPGVEKPRVVAIDIIEAVRGLDRGEGGKRPLHREEVVNRHESRTIKRQEISPPKPLSRPPRRTIKEFWEG